MTAALLAVTADGSCRVYVNGTLVDGKRSDWRSVWGVKLAKAPQTGQECAGHRLRQSRRSGRADRASEGQF